MDGWVDCWIVAPIYSTSDGEDWTKLCSVNVRETTRDCQVFHCRSDSHSHPNQVIATMTEDFVYILFCLQEGSDFTPTKRYDVHYYSYSPLIMTVAVELAPVGSFGVALRCSIIICSLL